MRINPEPEGQGDGSAQTLRTLRRVVRGALEEDLRRYHSRAWRDITTRLLVSQEIRAKGRYIFREAGVVAGLIALPEIFTELAEHMEVALSDIKWTVRLEDGDKADAGAVVAEVEAPARLLLTGERSSLNILGRLSGIATLTRAFVERVEGTGAVIMETRKTTPLLRELEKYATRIGGGRNHRQGLYDQVLIKDNHIALFGGGPEAVREAVTRTREEFSGTVEVEVQDLSMLEAALDADAHIILLDNMSSKKMREAVEFVHRRYGAPAEGAGKKAPSERPLLEASGGVTLENVREIAETGVDLISVGALTHSARALDVALDIHRLDAVSRA